MSVASSAETLLVPTDGLVIRSDVRLRPGVYVLPEGLTIAADGVTLDGNGATLVGADRQGAGVTIDGRSNVTVRNLRIREYGHGLVARRTRKLTLEQVHITSTAEVEANTVFLDIWLPVDRAYGGGILLDHVEDAEIVRNNLQHQFAGLLSYHCRRLAVRGNNASYCSGFGFHLFDTSDSVFEHNWADFCNRYQPRDRGQPVAGVGAAGHMGADAAGFLIVERSCRNIFRHNAARCGGDGFFLAGRDPRGRDVGCNDNLFEGNDGSLSPNIAFEATFSSGNIFRNNWADRCNYGFWLGYSTGNVLEGNRMLFNRQAGVAVEHGVDFQIRGNDLQSNGHGLLLWTNYNKDFHETLPGNRTLRNWVIEDNRFFRNGTAIAVLADKDHGIRPARQGDSADGPEVRPCDLVIRRNDIQDNRIGIHLYRTERATIEHNKINRNVEADIRREDDRDTVLGPNLGLRGAYL